MPSVHDVAGEFVAEPVGGSIFEIEDFACGSPAEYGKLIADETEKWGKVIRAAGIKAE